MSHLKAYRDAAIATIEAADLGFREIGPHGGTFTEAQLMHYSLKAPACRVAFLSVPKPKKLGTGELYGPANLAAYVIADDRKGGKQSFDVSLEMAEALAGIIDGNTFGVERGGMAQVTGIENLFTLSADKKGVTIAAVTFSADVRFGVNSYELDSLRMAPVETGMTLSELEILGLAGESSGFVPGGG